MKLAALLLTTGALVAFAPAPSSAMPVSNLANVAGSDVQDVRVVCRHGRCWRTGRRYFGPRYYYGPRYGYYPYSYYRPYRPAYGYYPGFYRPYYGYAPYWGRPGIGFGIWF